jgi:hypothetical protein
MTYIDADIARAAEEIERGRSRAKTPEDRAFVRELATNLMRVRLQRSRELVSHLDTKWRP